jgi:hypothetical protein
MATKIAPSRRVLRGSAALALAVSTAGLGIAVGTPVAQASPNSADGVCLHPDGVTVVLDFQQLGGSMVTRCVTGLPAGATGLQALEAADIPVVAVTGQPGAVCRLDGRPSATETIPVKGDSDYHESCAKFPPANAYWSYWQASNKGKWAYAQAGPNTQKVIPGGFEGWSFSLNTSNSPAPRINPVYATGNKQTGTGVAQPSLNPAGGPSGSGSPSSAPVSGSSSSAVAASSSAAAVKKSGSSSSRAITVVAVVVLVLVVLGGIVGAARRRKQP